MKIDIDQHRLTHEIDTLAAISDAPQPAVTRILYTKTDMQGRDYVKGLATEAGLEIREDAIGNTYLRWQGKSPQLQAIATGSHIDAIPHSGRYDGVVGVLGAIAALRALKQAGYQPNRSIEIVMFTAEEPTRFGLGCLGSRAMCGQLSPEALCALADSEGTTFEQARHEAGFSGALEEVRLTKGHYHAFVELHIEQGPELEAANKQIGVVTAIAAPATLRVSLKGQGGHAGACLMPLRKDALIPAAEIVQHVQKTALQCQSNDAVATTGLFNVFPGAVNSIPSEVAMEIDIRDTQLETRDSMVANIQDAAQQIAAKHGVGITVGLLNADPPTTCASDIVDTIANQAQSCNLSTLHMVSRAYHDTLFMAQICPVSMIFVPSKDGYSHRPEEYTAPAEIADGVKVLAATLAELASQ